MVAMGAPNILLLVLTVVFGLSFAVVAWLARRWVLSWSSTTKQWVLIAFAFLFSAMFSATAYAVGDHASWLLAIAVVSGVVLTCSIGIVVVRGLWR